jgi:hypothetical protein
VHAPVDNTTTDAKDSFYEDLFYQYPKYHFKNSVEIAVPKWSLKIL